MKYFITLALLLSLFTSCRKEEAVQGSSDYFNFGTAYGMCVGNCANFFSIHNNKIYPDSMNHMQAILHFQNTPLPNADYLFAKQLVDSFPGYLMIHADSTFGYPDGHDQGMIYIEYKKNGLLHYWYADTDTSEVPIEIRSYISLLKDIVVQL